MRNIVIASHDRLAQGLADTLRFVTGLDSARVLCAFVDPAEDDPAVAVARLMGDLDPDEETFVFTDMLGGSVMQRFFPYMGERVHLICGMNLPLVLEVALAGPEPFSPERVDELVAGARDAIVYVNGLEANGLDEDE